MMFLFKLLARLPLPLLTIYGAQAGDMSGTEPYIADFNADGYDDLLVSAQNHDGPGGVRVNAGAAYVIFEVADVKVIVDAESLKYVDGTEIDFVRQGLNEAFKFRNPNEATSCSCGTSITFK